MKNCTFLFIALMCLSIGCSGPAKKSGTVSEGDLTLRTLKSTHTPLESIGNVHSLRADDRILRGASPEGHTELLKENGVTDILIFRDGVGPHNDNEKKELRKVGYTTSQIHHIPMSWKNVSSFEKACADVVSALKIMHTVESNPRRKLYVHCTMGEDRTGLISGLYRMVFQGWSAQKAYQQEMCAYGFAESSPQKPQFVVETVNSNLKSLFARMAVLIESGALTKDTLNVAACKMSISENKVRPIFSESCKTL